MTEVLTNSVNVESENESARKFGFLHFSLKIIIGTYEVVVQIVPTTRKKYFDFTK